MQRKWAIIGMVCLLAMAAGCSSITGGDGGGGGGADWCNQGQASNFAMGQMSGEQASVSVEGVVERNGQDMCKVVYEYSGGQASMAGSMEIFYTQDDSTIDMITYGPDGERIGTTTSTTGGMGAGSGSGGMTTTTSTTGSASTGTTGSASTGTNDASTGTTTSTTGTTTDGNVEQNQNTAQVEGTLSYGAVVDGRLTGDDGVARDWRNANADAYQFQGSAGDQVTITMFSRPREADNPDTYLYLEGPGGSMVTQDDDSGEGLWNSRIDVRLPQDGTYTIWATTFGTYFSGSSETGPYTLTLSAS